MLLLRLCSPRPLIECAGQAPRDVRGGHERNGIDDRIRELSFIFWINGRQRHGENLS